MGVTLVLGGPQLGPRNLFTEANFKRTLSSNLSMQCCPGDKRYSSCDPADQPRNPTNFRGWRRVWGEPGENRGGTGGAQKNRGRTGGIWEENRERTGGFWFSFTKSTGGEAGALGQEPGENRGEGNFFETRDPTRDLKINEEDRP